MRWVKTFTWESQEVSAASGLMFPLQCSHMPKAQVT